MRRAHRGDVLGRRAAAAAHDPGARGQDPRHHLAEVRGPGGVDELALDARRQPGVGHDRAARSLASPAHPDRARRGRRLGPDAAVDPDDVDAGGDERPPPRPRASCRRAARAPRRTSSSATIGRSEAARASALTASSSSSRVANVSSTNRSTPPSRRPSICSRNADADVARGSSRSGPWLGPPSGPIDPATSTSRPATSRASRASWAARRFRRPARSASPNGARRSRLAPNVSVSMRSAPASMYSRWMAPMRSGRVVASSSRQARWGMPRLNRSVPIAPSASSGARARRSWNRARGVVGWADIAAQGSRAQPSAVSEPRRRTTRRPPSSSSRTCGGRGRPLYVDAEHGSVGARRRGSRRGRPGGAAAAGARPAHRSTRRSDRRPGSAAVPRGPRRRARGPARSARRSRDARRTGRGGSARSSPRRARPGRPPPRSRTWSTRATSQPARATSQRPGSTARRAGRRSAGIAASERRHLGGEPGRASARRGPTGNPPPTSSVSNDGSPPPSSARSASDRRTPSRQASTVRSPEPTWRWMPRQASGPSGPPPASMAAASSSSRIPNLLAQAPTARPAWVSGLTSGFSRRSTSGRRPARPARTGSPGVGRQGRRLHLGFDGDPAEWRALGRGTHRGPQVGVGLADPLERDPLVRDARPAGRPPTRRARRRWRRGRPARPGRSAARRSRRRRSP